MNEQGELYIMLTETPLLLDYYYWAHHMDTITISCTKY